MNYCTGEIDLSISAGSWTRYGRLNYSLIEKILVESEEKYHSPRYRISGISFFLNKFCDNGNLDPYGCMHFTTSKTLSIGITE
jgi:hypothetical protein